MSDIDVNNMNLALAILIAGVPRSSSLRLAFKLDFVIVLSFIRFSEKGKVRSPITGLELRYGTTRS